MDMFIGAFKSISPPKTAREALTLAIFKNHLQNLLHEPKDVKQLTEWYVILINHNSSD